jgi:hypothetical protein
LVGAVGACILFGVDNLFNTLGMKSAVKIDDPLNAFAVHGACGAWGVLAVGLFDLHGGVVYGNAADKILIPNVMGIVAIAAWVGVVSSVIWGGMKAAKIIREDEETERIGIDAMRYSLQREDTITHLIRTSKLESGFPAGGLNNIKNEDERTDELPPAVGNNNSKNSTVGGSTQTPQGTAPTLATSE